MDARRPTIWVTLDYPSGYVIRDSDGSLWRVPEMTAFDGDPTTLQEIHSGGDAAFAGELFIDLVGVAEIAARAKVDVGTVHAWRSRHDDFPVALATLKAGPVWAWASVDRWLRVRPPAGRPARHNVVFNVPAPTVHVLTHLRGDGTTKTFRLRDRFEPGTVSVEIGGKAVPIVEDPDGRRFTLPKPPLPHTDIRLEYRSILG